MDIMGHFLFEWLGMQLALIEQVMDEEVLEERHVQALVKIMPTHEEVEICRQYDGPVEDLGRTEHFILAVS
mgnify:CR=1 FL=1